jgi:hypothetical protein
MTSAIFIFLFIVILFWWLVCPIFFAARAHLLNPNINSSGSPILVRANPEVNLDHIALFLA